MPAFSGMRLVKRSVNQDDPGTYHLFYADAEGHAGTDLTFFPWAHWRRRSAASARAPRWHWPFRADVSISGARG